MMPRLLKPWLKTFLELNMQPNVLIVDKKDKLLGYATWEASHHGFGKHHRGFVVLISDDLGNVYLQKRRHRVFDGLWDFTAISHPYKNGKDEESIEEATDRALRVEMGIKGVTLKNVGAFSYFAKDGQWCENEFCHIFTGNFNGLPKPNKKFVYDAKKVTFKQLSSDIKSNPQKYTPWAILGVQELRKNNIRCRMSESSTMSTI